MEITTQSVSTKISNSLVDFNLVVDRSLLLILEKKINFVRRVLYEATANLVCVAYAIM